MADERLPDTCCQCCGTSLRVMKRCVQCQSVYYCSRSCQVKDWNNHKSICLKKLHKQVESNGYSQDEKCIFSDGNDLRSPDGVYDSPSMKQAKTDHRSQGIDFHTAFSKLIPEACSDARTSQSEHSGQSYLHKNTFYFDVPSLDSNKPHTEITVRSNREKLKLYIQLEWNGSEIYKVFASQLHIPLETIKIIHKGKLLTQETIGEFMTPKSVFQVIGEKCADESGINKQDIDIMMSQLNIDRKSAVMALQKKVDLVDAILEAANKA